MWLSRSSTHFSAKLKLPLRPERHPCRRHGGVHFRGWTRRLEERRRFKVRWWVWMRGRLEVRGRQRWWRRWRCFRCQPDNGNRCRRGWHSSRRNVETKVRHRCNVMQWRRVHRRARWLCRFLFEGWRLNSGGNKSRRSLGWARPQHVVRRATVNGGWRLRSSGTKRRWECRRNDSRFHHTVWHAERRRQRR